MTMVILTLILILLAAIILAVELLRLGRAVSRSLQQTPVLAEIAGPDAYRPMQRLFLREDFEFVAALPGFRPRMRSRLRGNRRAAMRLYLREIRHDFQKTWSLCRILAPISGDPHFAALLMRHFIVFHTLHLSLRVRCCVGLYKHLGLDSQSLVNIMAQLRRSAERALQNSDALALQQKS